MKYLTPIGHQEIQERFIVPDSTHPTKHPNNIPNLTHYLTTKKSLLPLLLVGIMLPESKLN